MRKLIDLTNMRFGRLVVIRRAENNIQNKPTWLCRCDCGRFSSPSGWNLHSGNTQSCGCRLGGHRHGFASRDKTHPLYTTWISMRARCTNPKQREFKNYGGRGVKVNKISGQRGVSRNHDRWTAAITSRGTRHYLGTFDTPEEAGAAYQIAARELHGKFYRED